MVGPSSRISKLLLGLLFLMIIFYIFMDFELYFRVQSYAIERDFYIANNTSNTASASAILQSTMPSELQSNIYDEGKPYDQVVIIPCNINPLCHVTVKALLLDHTNHYIFAPLATIFDDLVGFSRSNFITANMISFFHVGVAIVAAKLVASDNLGYRRLGVVLFQVRTFLDDLDGHVARVKKNIRGERSEVGTSGYYIDGICDGIGCIALLIGMFFFLKNNPPRRGYIQLPIADIKCSEPTNKPKLKYTTRKIAKKVVSFTGLLLLSSTAWNRYIAIYQDMLERNVSNAQMIKQTLIFKSTWFFCVAWAWRIVNVHALLHYVLLSIFCDKLWEFLKAIQYTGYLILLVIICATEMHALEAHNAIFDKYLCDTGWHLKGLIGVTGPHAGTIEAIANKIADDSAIEVGQRVGYKTEYADQTSKNTKLKFMTEIVFVRELLKDPLLTEYVVLIIDESYERSLTADVILSLLKKICKLRSNLKIVILSSAYDVSPLENFFKVRSAKSDSNDATKSNCVVLSMGESIHPVKIYYLKEPCSSYVSGTIDTIAKIHEKEPTGHIMAFLTGRDEIQQVNVQLREDLANGKFKNLYIYPLYGSMSANDQSRIFQRLPQGRRKVILLTNMGITPTHIPGVVYVIDCGYVKMPWYETRNLSQSLIVVAISQEIAQQRASLAGIHWPGKVYRLYTEEAYNNFAIHTLPEIRRADLTTIVILLKALGIKNLMQFEFLSPPPIKNLKSALEVLYAIEAIDDKCNLTSPLGFKLAEMTCSPMLSRMLFASEERECSDEIITIMAMLQAQPIFAKSTAALQLDGMAARRMFEAAEGDLITLLNVYQAFTAIGNTNKEFCGRYHLSFKNLQRAVAMRQDIVQFVKNKFNITPISCKENVEAICKSITAGFFLNAVHLQSNGLEYKQINNKEIMSISPLSVLYTLPQPPYLVYCNTTSTTKTFMENVTIVKKEWLTAVAPHYYE